MSSSRVLISTLRGAARQPSTLLSNTTTNIISRRTLTQTTRLNLKESASSDPEPDKFDKHKQDSLAKQKKGQGHWKPELASDSEESVKADRSHAESGSKSDPEAIKKLQERTKSAAEEKAKHGTSMRDGL
ncbi:hypothetical protein B0T17DRAFT_611701 [Bombardia bombarda]|uniref:Mitochondrial carrier protein pet8 protein n=1 Tax=Bombardia bombarda TaxID=252184 RepID=A0AA40CDS1_9PEZI|nr:hypothetical protein B0T17DRAFT_611701 [Bombardia bombarda]